MSRPFGARRALTNYLIKDVNTPLALIIISRGFNIHKRVDIAVFKMRKELPSNQLQFFSQA